LGLTDCKQFDNKFTHLVVKILDDIEDKLVTLSWIVPFMGSFLRIAQLGSAILGKWEFVQMINLLRKTIKDRKELRVRFYISLGIT
jgi:hypothetical protein